MDSSTWCLVVIDIGYQSVVDFLQWDVELILEFDYEGASTPMGSSTLMGLNGPHSELIFLDDTIYEGWMGYQFTFIYKDVLIIT